MSEDAVNGTIFDYLRLLLNDCSLVINTELNDFLSTPSVESHVRKRQNMLVYRSLEELTWQLIKNNSRVPSSIHTDGCFFEIILHSEAPGFPGTIMTTAPEMPVDEISRGIVPNLVRKAEKRSRFREEHRRVPYFIAFDCEESAFDEDDFRRTLYGKIAEISHSDSRYERWWRPRWQGIIDNPGATIQYWDDIVRASSLGWEAFLIRQHLTPNDYLYLTDPGVFLTETPLSNVTGMIFRSKWDSYNNFPNPFCEDEINLRGNNTPY